MLDKSIIQAIGRLEGVLKEQLTAHERIGQLLELKRQALRDADHKKITALCVDENTSVQLITEMEKQRLAIIAELTSYLKPDASEPFRMIELAEHLQEPYRGRILVFRQQLLAKMSQTQKESQITRMATESLVKHMQGLVQKVTSICSGVATYGRQGMPPKASMRVSTFSMTA